ncbi:MAG: phosphatidylglycerol lysyltransferase, partial [Treponema sp.]|nr:phosphatidylglycerol lysyltransferase [Treponema sp.]
MPGRQELDRCLSSMILSHSGWRAVFAESGDEEDRGPGIGAGHRVLAAAAGLVFAGYLAGRGEPPTVLVGTDTRPTGKAIADSAIRALLAAGCRVRYAGFVAAPEIMAWARSGSGNRGFLYVSASHNPVGHNGI